MNVYKNMGSLEKSEEYTRFTESEKQKPKPELRIVDNPPKSVNGIFKTRAYSNYPGYRPGYGGHSGVYYPGGDGSKWPSGLSNTGQSPILNHWLLRHNARSAYHENSQARAIVDRFADTVIDIGLIADSSPLASILGIEPEEARLWADNTSARFNLWASSKKSLRDETMTFFQSQRLAEIFQQRDNDYFVRLHYSSRKDLVNPLQIQFIDPDMIIGNGFTSTYGYQDTMYADKQPVDGIYRDSAGKETAYRVTARDDKGKIKNLTIPAFGPKSKRRFMLHGFQAEYANQGRGYSRLAHALQDFENLTDFTSAQIKKAIAQSCLVTYVKPSKDNPASNPLEGITSGTSGPPTEEEIQAVESGDCADLVTYQNVPEAAFDTPGSFMVAGLSEGEDLKAFENTAPSDTFAQFVDSFTAYLAASMGIPIEVLLMRFGENYSASRAALILFWRVAEIWRKELIADFLAPVYEAWLSEEIAAGRIFAPGWSDPVMRAAWLSCDWWGAPMPNIDPAREAKAARDYIEMGATDLNRVSRNLNGSRGDDNRAKLKRQIPELTRVPWSANKSEETPEEESAGKKKKDKDKSRKPGRPRGT